LGAKQNAPQIPYIYKHILADCEMYQKGEIKMYRIGIDLGGTNIVAGVVDDNYRIIGSSRCKTRLPRPAKEIIGDMANIALEAAANAKISFDDISYVGVGCPGTCNNDSGIVEYSNNLDFVNVPIREILYDAIKKPIYIENDANAAALGETLAGAAKGAQSCVCITLGTGVGSGIIIDGKIYSGFNFSGGELGHTVIMLNGEPCTCGRNGCWESYASATALIRQTKAAMQADKNSIMWDDCKNT
jgi:glucokinase